MISVEVGVRDHAAAVGVDLPGDPGERAVTQDGSTSYEIRVTVFDGGAPVKELGAAALAFSGGRAEAMLTTAWPEARRWSPEDPYLYTLLAELRCNDEVVDRTSTRFGFREVWLEGPNFILNGLRTNLRGDAWHYQGFVQQTPAYARSWFRACRAVGINFIRLHAMPYPAFYLDVADEEGMLIVAESAIYGSGKAMQADHPRFIEACQRHLAALVRRDRNHPSVIIWSMQNEMRWVDGREGYKAAMPELNGSSGSWTPPGPYHTMATTAWWIPQTRKSSACITTSTAPWPSGTARNP